MRVNVGSRTAVTVVYDGQMSFEDPVFWYAVDARTCAQVTDVRAATGSTHGHNQVPGKLLRMYCGREVTRSCTSTPRLSHQVDINAKSDHRKQVNSNGTHL